MDAKGLMQKLSELSQLFRVYLASEKKCDVYYTREGFGRLLGHRRRRSHHVWRHPNSTAGQARFDESHTPSFSADGQANARPLRTGRTTTTAAAARRRRSWGVVKGGGKRGRRRRKTTVVILDQSPAVRTGKWVWDLGRFHE
jgi:hypothetical protein